MAKGVMPQIRNIVFLMLENRSLDNVLGWLYRDGKPANVYPASSSPSYDGLVAGRFSNPSYAGWWWWRKVKEYPVVEVPGNLGHDQDRVPAYDPYEELRAEGWKGVMNQVFGTQDEIARLPTPSTRAAMRGFLQDYYADYMRGWKGLDILWGYTPQQLPVINGLARAYAVSDRWFCSVPSQTNPNRAYSLCGTSMGRESNANLRAIEQFDAPTVINGLAGAGKTWGLYFTDVWQDGNSFTEYTFPWITKARANGEVSDMRSFFERAKAGTLPDFSYIEPSWGYGKGELLWQGTDYHPPTHLLPGERFLNQVYRAVRSSPQWGQSLLIITFDEHGGTYDHVSPPWGAINPDGKKGACGFDFNLLGVRVPALLVSPFVKPASVFRAPNGSSFPFDHTSFIKTLLLWAGVDPGSVNMGQRMPQAPTFEGVLSEQPVNSALLQIEPPSPAGGGHSLNEQFAGVAFPVARAILAKNMSLKGVMADIAKYKSNHR